MASYTVAMCRGELCKCGEMLAVSPQIKVVDELALQGSANGTPEP